jgi:hypothetical protein
MTVGFGGPEIICRPLQCGTKLKDPQRPITYTAEPGCHIKPRVRKSPLNNGPRLNVSDSWVRLESKF